MIAMISLIHQPDGADRLGDLIVENLSNGNWTVFRAAAAFAKHSGVKHLVEPLKKFLKDGKVKISIGIDHLGTSVEGLTELLAALGDKGEGWVFHNEAQSTFHPKLYLFANDASAECFIGSGNLTEGGLFTNYEAFIQLRLDKDKSDEREFLSLIIDILDKWSNPSEGTALKLTYGLIPELQASGNLLTEAEIREVNQSAKAAHKGGRARPQVKRLFAAVKVKPAPQISRAKAAARPATERVAKAPSAVTPQGFVMFLQQTDVGVGQTTRGASKRSPEIFVPLAARDDDPSFWGWKKLFRQDRLKPGKWDRHGVRMRLGGQIIEVNMMTWPDKSDFRLRNANLRDAGRVGDVLRIEKSEGTAGFDYYVEIVPTGSSDYEKYLALCINPVRNSKKRWGYY